MRQAEANDLWIASDAGHPARTEPRPGKEDPYQESSPGGSALPGVFSLR
jgi:hypothetical protein